jgi:hypothetical protein
MAIILPQRWRFPPQYPAQVDLSNPLAVGMLDLVSPILRGPIQGIRGTESAVEHVTGPLGRGWKSTPASNSKVTFNAAYELDTGRYSLNHFTVLCVFTAGALANWRTIFSLDKAGYAGSAFAQWTNVGNLEFLTFGGGGLTVSGAIVAGQNYAQAFVCRYTGGKEVWSNGSLIGSSSGTFFPSPNVKTPQFLAADDLTGRAMDGIGYLMAVYDRALTSGECARLTSNPWQIFRPQQARIYSFPSGGSSLNVSATTDALTLAEYAATIGKSINVSANVDALTLAEYAATVSLSRNVSANVDALTLAEYAATIGYSRNVSATADALVIAGLGCTVSLSNPFNPAWAKGSNVILSAA